MTNCPSHVRVDGPLAAFAPGYPEWLQRHGYTPGSTGGQVRWLAQWSRWLAAEGRDVHRLSLTDVERFLVARRRVGRSHFRSMKAMAPALAALGEQGVRVMPSPTAPLDLVEAALARYRQYLLQERGLGQDTTRGYVDAVRPFVHERLGAGRTARPWGALDASVVMAFVVRRTANQSRSAAKLTATALRAFLGFLHVEGLIPTSLREAVPAVAGWRLAGLPTPLRTAHIQALLAACDRRTRTGRRAYAVVTLLVRLGLRAGEAAALRLDDIDWRAGTLRIRGKGPQVDLMPWPPDVGEAVVASLRQGRPATALDRAVFVRAKAPHHALSASGISEIVAAAARRAGLGVIRAHRLRHTSASQLLRAGAPLREIGPWLRHRRASTTALYANVDRALLRTIAGPWPGGVE